MDLMSAVIFFVTSNGGMNADCEERIKPAQGRVPTQWRPVHLASSPHLRIGHTSIMLSQDKFLRQPGNVLTKKTMNSYLDHSHRSAKTG